MIDKLEKFEGIKTLVDHLAKKTFGIYLTAAISRKICIECRNSIKKFKSKRNQSLYRIDGLCDNCRRKFKLG